MTLLRAIKYWFSGGKRRWFARKSKNLLAGVSAQKQRGTEDNLWGSVVEALDVGLEIAPDQALELCIACDPFLEPAPGPTIGAASDALLHRAARLASGPAWQLGWMISKRLKQAEPLKQFGIGLAMHLASRGAPDALVMHLEDCRQRDFFDTPLLGNVLQQFLARNRLRDSRAWLPFFRQLPASQLPPVFELHALLGRTREAVNLATSSEQIVEAIELCLVDNELDLVRQALLLVDRVPDAEQQTRVHEALGEALTKHGAWPEALLCFRATGNTAGQSMCHERMGDLRQALLLCPSTQSERMARLIESLAKSALETAARGELNVSMTALMELLAFVAKEADPSPICLEWRGILERHRAELLRAGRERLRAKPGAGQAADESRQGRLARSAFEELAGEWCEAALLLEQTGELGDRLKASQLWEKDHRYGEAVRALGPLAERKDVQLRLAQLRERGGDATGAAVLFEHLQCWSDARRAYEAAGQPAQAARCYLQEHGELAAAQSAEYANQLIAAGQVDELLQLYLGCLLNDPHNLVLLDRLRSLVREKDSQIRSPLMREAAAKHLTQVTRVDLQQNFERGAPRWIDQARAEVLQRYGRIWGMDLGTSKSAVALFDLEQRAPLICPHEGKPHFPSTLCIDKHGNEIVGLDALDQLRPGLRGSIEDSKRAMGTRREYKIGDRRFTPAEVAARLLIHARGLVESFLRGRLQERVLDLARKHLGEACPREWIEAESWAGKTSFSAPDAMITIPAYFNFDQRRATRDAAEIAGIKLHRLVSEPTAACLYTALARKKTGNILVIDLGAGTLDLSYLSSSSSDAGETLFEVEKIFGDSQFGSRDFDAAIERELMSRLKEAGLTDLSQLDRRRLRAAAEQLKIALSSANSATFDLVSFCGRPRHTLELSAARLQELLSPQLARLTEVCRAADGLHLDHLVLVGGPMFSPLIRQHIERLFQRKADAVVDPRTAVAMGAACQGAVLSNREQVPMLLLDIVPFALGVLVKDPDKAPAVSFHIARGTRIPHQSRKSYATTVDNQPTVDVRVFQGLGESTDPAANSCVARFSLEGLPPAKAGELEIDIVFDIDANGVLEVTAKDVKTGRAKSVTEHDTTWMSLSDRADMTNRLTKSRRWAGERDELASFARTVASLSERLQELERQQYTAIWQKQFEAWQGLQRQSFDNLAPAELTLLGEMYNGGITARDRFVLELDRARNLLPRCQRFVEAANAINLFAAEAEVEKELRNLRELGSQLEALSRTALANLEPMAARFQRWIATMAHCATLFSDPRDRLIACHDAGDWLGAIDAFKRAFAAAPPAAVPLSAVRRKLDGLARLTRRDEYRQAIAEHRETLALRELDFDRLNEFCRHVQPAMAWVFVQGQATGSGFLAGSNLVVTNLHVILDGERPTAPERITVHVGGAARAVTGMKFPSRSGVDLVVLQLAEELNVRPMRVGYGSLIEVGERVLAIGFPLPEGSSFEENLLLDHGIVNRIRTRPDSGGRELELGLRIFPGMSGGPVFNDRGEVVGISTFVRYMSAGDQQRTFVDKSSHAIGVDPLHDLLPQPW